MNLRFWKNRDKKRQGGAIESPSAAHAAPRGGAAIERKAPQEGHDTIEVAQLDEAARIFEDESRHAELGTKTLRLPDWFDFDLPPDSIAFQQQQLRLWEVVTGRAQYDVSVNEDTPGVGDTDAWRRPSFYAWGNSRIAGEQVMAMGLILLHSGARPGSRIIEYGAGFGQNAVAFARLGAKVDTVDINPGYCTSITTQAERFEIDLTSHVGAFGFNPAGTDSAFDVILFYESFHHCLDFATVIPQLERMLAPGGKILLAGEPIFRDDNPAMPIEWGIRLEWQNVAVMRIRGWMELGFREHYLTRQFMNSGFMWTHHAIPNAGPANLYEFQRWTSASSLEHWRLSPDEERGWHTPQNGGRWTRGEAYLRLPRYDGAIEITLISHHRSGRNITLNLGTERLEFHVAQGERKTLRIRSYGLPDQDLHLTSNTDRFNDEHDDELGIFVEAVGPAAG